MGKPENTEAAHKNFLERCKSNSTAALGKYEGGSGSAESTYVENYRY
jgi:fructose-bisphosphate aldolase class I